MLYNLNSGWCSLMAEGIAESAVAGGKVFVVASSSHPQFQALKELFIPDPEGLTRFYTTITAALGACVANRGDIIYVAEGYTETESAAAGLAIGVAGVTIIGLGNGTLRPTISFSTSTAATVTITAANVTLKNIGFDFTGIDALASGVVISAANVSLVNCYAITANASGQAVLGVLTTAAANNLLIDGCQFVGSSDAGTTAAVRIVGGDSITIRNCYFLGAYTSGVGAIQGLTTDSTNLTITNNTIVNLTASATKAAVFTSGSTGIVAKNICGIGSGAAPFTFAAGWWAGNWSAAAVGTNGTLV